MCLANIILWLAMTWFHTFYAYNADLILARFRCEHLSTIAIYYYYKNARSDTLAFPQTKNFKHGPLHGSASCKLNQLFYIIVTVILILTNIVVYVIIWHNIIDPQVYIAIT